jgi:hypothetical protein
MHTARPLLPEAEIAIEKLKRYRPKFPGVVKIMADLIQAGSKTVF